MTLIASAMLIAAMFTRPMERVNSLDPMLAQSVYDSSVIHLLYKTPLEIDYFARPYRLVPGACKLPEVSSDGLTYILHLTRESREGSLAITAHDIVRSLSRVRDVANASPAAWTMKSVRDIKARDDATVEITLREKSHVFPWMLAMSSSAIRREDGSGTGPFTLAKWRKNHDMVFQRRESSRDGFNTVRYLIINDISTQWLMFLSGEIDFLGEISRDNWDAVITENGELDSRLKNDGVKLFSTPSLDIRYIGFNMNDPVLGKNRELRQALTCAFDFPTWQKFYNNRINPANGPVPHTVSGHREDPNPYSFNLQRARDLLAKAGYPNGIDPATGRRLQLELAIGRASQDSREAGELLASFFEKIGVKLTLSFNTWNSFLQAVNESRVQLYMMAWVGDYPDAENFLQLFYSRNKSPGPNHSNYENPEFDKAFENALKATNEKERNIWWEKCQEIVVEDCPWIFTHSSKSYTLVRPTVENYHPGNFPYGQERHLKQGLKK